MERNVIPGALLLTNRNIKGTSGSETLQQKSIANASKGVRLMKKEFDKQKEAINLANGSDHVSINWPDTNRMDKSSDREDASPHAVTWKPKRRLDDRENEPLRSYDSYECLQLCPRATVWEFSSPDSHFVGPKSIPRNLQWRRHIREMFY